MFTLFLVVQIPRKAIFPPVPIESEVEPFASFVTLDDNAYAAAVQSGRMSWQLRARTQLSGVESRTAAFEFDEPLPPPERFDLAALASNAMEFDAGMAEDVLPEIRRAGGSSGGARPKAFIGYNPATGEACAEREDLPAGFEHWIVKFNTRADGEHAGENEFRWHQAAIAAGAKMAPCRLIETKAGRFVATRRFDRPGTNARLHFSTAAGLLHANFRIPGEEYLTLFRLTDALTRDYSAKIELFRRVALNVFGHNRDDHLKNFGYLMDGAGRWSLAPFYDFTRANGPNGWHTLSVSGEGENPTESDLLRLADDAGLQSSDAHAVLANVHAATDGLQLRRGR